MLFVENIDKKKKFFVLKMSYLSLPFGLIRIKEKIKLDLPKNYGASQYIKRLPYISREDSSFQNSIIDIGNKRSDLRKFLLATSNYGRTIQENINSVVAGGKFSQAVVLRVLDQKNKVFLSHQHHLV